jgi:curved DNA-binding protein CbpA
VAIRQPLGDLYDELGVARGATRDEITAAYRARAKELHPDARPGDAGAAERFTRVGAAYRVLADPVERARYDESREVAPAGPTSPQPVAPASPRPAPAAVASKPFRLTRKAAGWALVGGGTLIVLGLLAGGFVMSLQRHDADLRSHGVATVATEIQVNGERRLEFETASGRVVRARESVKTGEEAPLIGSRVPIHYDRSDPTSIVTDDSHAGRNITLWIVAVKFVIGGAVLLWFGARRFRRA